MHLDRPPGSRAAADDLANGSASVRGDGPSAPGRDVRHGRSCRNPRQGPQAAHRPACKPVADVLEAWLDELSPATDDVIFPSARGGRLSADAVASLLKKHVTVAGDACPSLKQKNVTFHCLRHTTAMDLLHAGVEQRHRAVAGA